MADRPTQTSSAPDLERSFGFGGDQGDETWIQRLRQSQTPLPVGSIGEYRVTKEIGRGGQGVVYQAVQPRTERIVALKCLPGWDIAGTSARERFEREIEAICKLSHPGIVTLHEVQVVSGQPVIAMEWVEGTPIDTWASDKSLKQILEVFLQVCEAVAHAHRRGVIHRDLKPSNILVDARDQSRVLDFGLARMTAADARRTMHGGFVGTPHYASPEQIGEKTVDTRTDIYSLGVILYQLACGQLPFHGKSAAEIFDAVRNAAPPSPRAINSALPADLESIILKAMALEPERRYGTVDALADDIRHLQKGEPVLAHRAGAWYRISRAIRRKPWLYGGATAAILAVTTLAIVSGVLSLQLSAQSHQLSAALKTTQDALKQAERSAQASAASVQLLQDLLDSVQTASRSRARQDAGREVILRAIDRLEKTSMESNEEKLVLWSSIAEVASLNLYTPELERCVIAAKPLVEKVFGHEGPEAALWMIYDGLVCESHRDFLGAMEHYREARDTFVRCGKTETDNYARATYNLGAMKMGSAGPIEEAEPLLKEALQIRRKLHDEHSPLVVRGLAGLGDLMRRQKRFAEAHEYLDQAEKDAVGLDDLNPKIISTRVLVARLYVDERKFDEAKRVTENVLAKLDARVAPDSPLLVAPLIQLVDIADTQGDYEKAVTLSDRLLVAFDRANDPARPIEYAVKRSVWLKNLNRVTQAQSELDDALIKAEALQPANQKLIDSVQSAQKRLRDTK